MSKKKKAVIILLTILLSPIVGWIVFGGGKYHICRQIYTGNANKIQSKCTAPLRSNGPSAADLLRDTGVKVDRE